MTFEQYYKIMKTHGMCEFFFQFDGTECAVIMEIHDLHLVYILSTKDRWESFYDLDACVFAPVFSENRCLREIWDEIEIIAVDGSSVDEYDAETCSFNYVQHIADQGELLWSCHLGTKRSFWIQWKYVMLGAWILPILSILYPLTGNSNWNILFLTGGCALISLVIAAVVLLRNRMDINYQITTKKVFIFNGLARDVEFSNIKNVKLHKSWFNTNRGIIKLKLKKGCSINYVLEEIPEVDQVYNLILKKIQ